MSFHKRKPSNKIRTKIRPNGSDGYDYEIVLINDRLRSPGLLRGRRRRVTHRKTADRKVTYTTSYKMVVRGKHEDIIAATRNVMPVHVHTNRRYKKQTTSLFVRGESSVVIFKTMFPESIYQVYKLIDKPITQTMFAPLTTNTTSSAISYGTLTGSLLVTHNNVTGAAQNWPTGGTLTINNSNIFPPMQAFTGKIERKTAVLEFTGDKPIIRTKAGDIDVELLAETMKQLTNVLCVLNVHMSTLEQYPALQSAYDNFRLLEKLVKSDEDIDPA